MHENNGLQRELYDGTERAEVSGDFILPDSMEDAKSVLHVSAATRRKDVFLSENRLEYEGEINYDVLYLSESGEIGHLNYKSDFNGGVNIKGVNSDSTAVLSFLPPSVTARLSNPRRVGIRTKLPVHIRAYENDRDEGDGGIPDGEVEKREESVGSLCVCCAGDKGIGVSEDIVIPSDKDEIDTLAAIYAKPVVTELRASDGKVVFRGEINITLLYKTTDGEYESFSKKIPVSHIIQTDGAEDGDECKGEIVVYDMNSEVSGDVNGDKRVVELDFLYDIYACCMRNREENIVTDVYFLDKNCQNEYKPIKFKSLEKMITMNTTVSGKTESDGKKVRRILFATCDAEDCECKYDGNRVICSGNVMFNCVALYDDGVGEMSSSLPFKAESEAVKLSQNAQLFAQCRTSEAKVWADGENVYGNTEAYITVEVIETDEKNVLSACTAGEDAGEVILPLTLYYPTKDDSLWSVAKKYHTKISDIISANSLNGTDISSRNVIVIPKR